MTFAYGSVNMDYVLLLNLNPGNIRGLNQTLNSQGIDIPSPIRTLCIPWCNIVPIDHLTILGRFKSWGYTSCLCRVMECGNRKPCSLGIGNGPVLWTPIGAIGYNLQSEGHVRGYELWDSANINSHILSRWKRSSTTLCDDFSPEQKLLKLFNIWLNLGPKFERGYTCDKFKMLKW